MLNSFSVTILVLFSMGAYGSARYQELEALFKRGNDVTFEEVGGGRSGRCFSEGSDQAWGGLLYLEKFQVDENGPLFPPVEEIALGESEDNNSTAFDDLSLASVRLQFQPSQKCAAHDVGGSLVVDCQDLYRPHGIQIRKSGAYILAFIDWGTSSLYCYYFKMLR